MKTIGVKKLFEFLLRKVEAFTNSSYWIIKTSLLFLVVSLILSTPYSFTLPFRFTPAKVDNCSTCTQAMVWAVNYITLQIKNPFSKEPEKYLVDKPQNDGFISHLNKKWSRITVPVIAWIFHLNMTGVYFLQYLCGILFMFFLIKLILRVTNDKTIAFLAAVSIGSIYLSKTFFVDYVHYDCFGYLFLLLAAYQRNVFWSVPFFILAAFTDERALIVTPLVFLFFIINDAGVSFSIKDILKRYKIVFAFVFTVGIYLVLRTLLKNHLDIVPDTSFIGLTMLKYNMKTMPLALFATLEGTMILIFLTILLGLINKNILFVTLLCAGIAACLLSAFLVADLSRSISYIFPAILVSIVYFYKTEPIKTSRYIFLCIMLFCVFFPTNDFAMRPLGGESWLLPVFLKYVH